MAKDFLHLEDVYVRYTDGKGQPFTVLNDVDLKVRQGELITVVGPSGCGKSTLLRLVLGSEQPTSGQVLFRGRPVPSPDRSRGIVFQKYSLFPHMTVLDNIIYGLDAEAFSLPGRFLKPFHYRGQRRAYKAEAEIFLERMGLGGSGEKYPHQLSGGMRQRVAIAQSLIMKPAMLLMDEPFGALDDSIRQEMQLFLLEQWEAHKMTIFFVTHDLEEACFLGSRVLVLSQFYQTDHNNHQGAKVIADLATPGDHPKPTSFKYSPEMTQMVEKIRKEGLNPDYRQHLKDFDLSHADAFRTVIDSEWKQNQ